MAVFAGLVHQGFDVVESFLVEGFRDLIERVLQPTPSYLVDRGAGRLHVKGCDRGVKDAKADFSFLADFQVDTPPLVFEDAENRSRCL